MNYNAEIINYEGFKQIVEIYILMASVSSELSNFSHHSGDKTPDQEVGYPVEENLPQSRDQTKKVKYILISCIVIALIMFLIFRQPTKQKQEFVVKTSQEVYLEQVKNHLPWHQTKTIVVGESPEEGQWIAPDSRRKTFRHQPVQISCNAEDISHWRVTDQTAFVSQRGILVLRLPLKPLTLVQHHHYPTPQHHHLELYSFLRDNHLPTPIYIHSASIYAAILIAASTSAKITVSPDFPDLDMLIKTFVFNKLGQNLQIENKEDGDKNRDKAGTIISSSPSLAANYLSQKQVILTIEEQTTNTIDSTLYGVYADKPCQPSRLSKVEGATLKAGTYINLIKKKLSSTHIVTLPNNSKRKTYQAPTIRVTCNTSELIGWRPSQRTVFVTQDGIRVLRLPMQPLVMLQHYQDPIPYNHFSELYTYLKENILATLNQGVYLHSAPIEASLLIVAFSGNKVTISSEFPNAFMLVKSLVFSKLYSRCEMDSKGGSGKDKAKVIVTTSSLIASEYMQSKHVILISDGNTPNPSRQQMKRISQLGPCFFSKVYVQEQKILPEGVYTNRLVK